MAAGVVAQLAVQEVERAGGGAADPARAANAARVALAFSFDKVLKKAAKDPASIKYESMRVDEAGRIACAEFRAKNSFGALDKSFAVLAADGVVSVGSEKAWNKHCTGQMYDQALLFR